MKRVPNSPDVADRQAMDHGAHRQMVRAFIVKLVGDPLLAEDLAQDVFVRVQSSSAAFRGESSVKSWLCAIALNVISDCFRNPRRQPETAGDHNALSAIPDGDNIEDNLLEKEMASCIGGYVLLLPGRLREVVALHDIAGLSHRELAPMLGISQGHSRVLLHRGRAALKKQLQENCRLSFGADAVPCERKVR